MRNTAAPRPLGLTLLAALAIANGVIALVIGIAISLDPASDIPTFQLPASMGAIYGPAGLTSGDGARVTAVIGALYLAFGAGAYLQRRWSWALGLGLSALSLLAVAVSAANGAFDIVGGVVALGAGLYLTRPYVKAALSRS